MHYLFQNWTLDPFVAVVGFVVIWHEIGLARLSRRSRASRTRRRRIHALYFYGGLALILLAVCSPIDHWAKDYFFVHVTEHILLMFFAPLLIVVGAPWLVLIHALPVALRRRVGRFVMLGRIAPVLRALGRALTSGAFAVLAFNATMLAWHIPALFDLAQDNEGVHIWLMHGSFFVAGVLFWLQILPSRPFRPRLSVTGKIGAIVGSNVVMFVLAMSLSLFTSTSWYRVYAHVPGVKLSAFADQQIGAAILWVCGDFWALPALIVVLRQALDAGENLSTVIDRALGRRALGRLS